jgi:hypothetical protein
MPRQLRLVSGESFLDDDSVSLIRHIRRSLTIQAEMFRRILDTTPKPSILLAELLEDAGNRYLNYAALVSAACRDELAVEDRGISIAVERIVN